MSLILGNGTMIYIKEKICYMAKKTIWRIQAEYHGDLDVVHALPSMIGGVSQILGAAWDQLLVAQVKTPKELLWWRMAPSYKRAAWEMFVSEGRMHHLNFKSKRCLTSNVSINLQREQGHWTFIWLMKSLIQQYDQVNATIDEDEQIWLITLSNISWKFINQPSKSKISKI